MDYEDAVAHYMTKVALLYFRIINKSVDEQNNCVILVEFHCIITMMWET